MNIGVIGTGRVGGGLGKVLNQLGHSIRFGVRSSRSKKLQILMAETNFSVQIDSIRDAVRFGEVVIIATPATAIPDVIEAGGHNWNGKIVVDATNRFGPGSERSVAEDIASLAPGAHVVKAFNTIGAEHYANPQFGDLAASMFICGDDTDAKAKVTYLAEQMGFDVVDAGGLSNAIMLESLARLWVSLSQEMGRNIALKLLRR